MVTKLKRQDSGWVVPLDADLLASLGFDDQSELEVTAVGQSLVLRVSDPARQVRFEAALAETNQQFGRALKRLAE